MPGADEQPHARRTADEVGVVVPRSPEDAITRGAGDDACEDVPVDERIARRAARRRGLVTTGELHAEGLTRHGIDSRVRRGWLHRRHRGVLSVGHLGDIPLARETAALLACGEGAAVSHGSAAAIHTLVAVAPDGPVHVSMRPGRQATHPGIAVHRPRRLDAHEVCRREGLLVTSVERTIRDLAATIGLDELDRMVAEAQRRRLTTRAKLLAAVRGPGAEKLRTVLDDGPRFTRSEAERRLLALLRRAGLPLPQTNVRIGALEVDAVWPDRRLVVEIDGFAFHGDRRAFETDRRRDQELTLAGYDVVRITWRQLVDEPERTVAVLAALLAGR